jgi:alpha-glucosidase (family GH31 glycosyl hydrolase)
MRPMWLEYPEDSSMNTVLTQFMFGDSILFAPKLEEPVDHINLIPVNLPAGNWYNFNTGNSVTGPSSFLIKLDATEIGLFFKGGSILPILAHQRELSLM